MDQGVSCLLSRIDREMDAHALKTDHHKSALFGCVGKNNSDGRKTGGGLALDWFDGASQHGISTLTHPF